MKALGIDPSLRAYGWAIHDSNAIGLNRKIASGHEGTLKTTVQVARFMHFQSLVQNLIEKYKPDVVGIESPAYGGDAQFVNTHFGLMLFSLIPTFEARINCVLFDPSTLKLLAKEDPLAKRGTMGKLDMQRKVQLDTLDPMVIDNNEADAYLVGKYASRLMELVYGLIDISQLTISEKRVFILRTKKVKTLTGTKIKRIGHIFKENNRFFEFSRIPFGSVSVPNKHEIKEEVLEFLESLEA